MKDVDKLDIRSAPGGCILAVKVVPGSSRDRVVGVLGDALKLCTSAAAEKGKANTAVTRTLASTIGVDQRDVELVKGHSSPHKEFRVGGLEPEQLRQILRSLQI